MRGTAAAVALVALLGRATSADPAAPITYYKVDTPAHLTTDGGTDLRLPPGYYLPDRAWRVLDAEMRRLQDTETRLRAENADLRTTLSGWQPGWKTLTVTLVLGLAVGAYLEYRL